jgi:hypothetical protein
MNPLSNLPSIDDLDRAILTLSAKINTETYELLVLIRQFDERAGWLKWGLGNCAEWLHYRCDFSMNAAREKVRVAHALKTLPKVAAKFKEGELSYSKVRAISRVAGADSEDELLSFASQTTTARVEERCRELRCGTAESLDGARRAFANRSLRIRRNADSGTMSITIELPIETGGLVEKALDKARDDSMSGAEFIDESWSARHVDAHHIEHWSAGGEISLDNLMLLCSQQHKLVHEGGFAIERDYQNRWFFKRPDGRAVPACGYRVEDIADDELGDVSRQAGPRSKLFDNPSREGLLSGVKNFVSDLGPACREPPAPGYWH